MGHFPVHCKLSAIFGVQSIIKTGLKNTRLIVTAKVDVTIVMLTFEGVLLSRGPIYKISYDNANEVPTDLFKAGGETVLDRMHRICVAIWETGEWPEEWTFSTFIPLPKKGDLKQCASYRTIALVSHASKILLRIILERIRVKTETEIADEQAGFRQGRGTRDQITNLRILMHKAREHQQPRPGWTTSRRGQDSPWKSQSE